MEEPTRADPEFGDPTRRTYLAQERTLLAWWRTALACLGFGLAIGRILPEVAHVDRGPFLLLGIGYGLLGVVFVVLGAWRQRASRQVFQAGGYQHLSDALLVAVTVYMIVLGAGSVLVLFYKI